MRPLRTKTLAFATCGCCTDRHSFTLLCKSCSSPTLVNRSTLMPRAKVAAQDRLRVAKACRSCRSSKRRCDGRRPCQVCAHRNQGSSCTYGTPIHATTPDSTSLRPDGLHGKSASSQPPASASASPYTSSCAGPSAQMLLTDRGEAVYVNSISGLSLLQHLKSSLRGSMGSSRFVTEPDNADVLDAPGSETADMPAVLDFEMKEAYLQSYLVAVSIVC